MIKTTIFGCIIAFLALAGVTAIATQMPLIDFMFAASITLMCVVLIMAVALLILMFAMRDKK